MSAIDDLVRHHDMVSEDVNARLFWELGQVWGRKGDDRCVAYLVTFSLMGDTDQLFSNYGVALLKLEKSTPLVSYKIPWGEGYELTVLGDSAVLSYCFCDSSEDREEPG